MKNKTVCTLGLGYVGLSLAEAFAMGKNKLVICENLCNLWLKKEQKRGIGLMWMT